MYPINFRPILPSTSYHSSTHDNTSSTILRPTPLHPLQDNDNLPLDLSTTRQSVIHHHSPTSTTTPTNDSNISLPKCNNLNPNWIALKFGVTSGPNRMSYPREFKLMVIEYYRNHGQNKYRTCKQFQITKSMLNGWLSKVEKIRESKPGSLKSGRSGRRPQFPDIEKQLYSLYTEQLNQTGGGRVGNRWLRETAKQLAVQQTIDNDPSTVCQFSERWLNNFKKRHRINAGTTEHSGESSADTNSIRSDALSIEDLDMSTQADSDSEVEVEEVLSDSPTPTIIARQENEVSSQPGQLPIQAFYEKYPWLCRKGTQSEPGRRGRKVQFPDVEKVLYERLTERQSKGDRISNRWLQDQARQLAALLCPGILEEATKSSRCLFSEHWLHNFKKRYGVSLKYKTPSPTSSTCQQSPDSNKSSSFSKFEPIIIPSQPSPVSSHNQHSNAVSVLQLQNWFMQQCYLPSSPPQYCVPVWPPSQTAVTPTPTACTTYP